VQKIGPMLPITSLGCFKNKLFWKVLYYWFVLCYKNFTLSKCFITDLYAIRHYKAMGNYDACYCSIS
jgi:hypothetical protein